MTLGRSWLVQRLQKPPSGGFLGLAKDNPFSFGGVRNGGLKPEAMELLRDLWSFDYMGAAEFEFGAVPKALAEIYRRDNNVAWTLDIALSQVTKPWIPTGWSLPDLARGATGTIYVISPEEWHDDIVDRLKVWATDRVPKDKKAGDYRLKEAPHLAAALRPATPPADDKYHSRPAVGWLELDNGFLFFTDQEMANNAAQLFGVDTKPTS